MTLEAIVERYQVRTAVDLGCGLGVDVAMMDGLGLDAWGLDGSEALRAHVLFDPARYLVGDLRTPLELGEFDLVWCREVAEHVPEAKADALIANITHHGRVVYFTAAPPGQPGIGHVNPQRPGYWIERFRQFGFVIDRPLTRLNAKHPNRDDRINGRVYVRTGWRDG